MLVLTLGVHAEGKDDFGEAQWIGATSNMQDGSGSRSIWLRRTFRCTKAVKKATLNISGLGFYEVYLNYKKVGEDLMAPAVSDYNKTVFYNTIDLTDKIKSFSGSNAIEGTINKVAGALLNEQDCQKAEMERKRKAAMASTNLIYVLLGNSFYREMGQRYHKLVTNYGPETLLFHLVLEYADGSKEIIDSNDNQWFVNFSPVVFNSIYGGEDYDARLESPTRAAEDNITISQWRPAVIQQAPKGELRKQLSSPVRVVETNSMQRRLPNYVFDMGKEISGFPQVTVRGERGKTIRLIVGNELDKQGNVIQAKTGGPHTYLYILRGKGGSPFVDELSADNSRHTETWHPHFSYYSYRYVQIEGAVFKGERNPNGQPVIEEILSCMVANTASQNGKFECSIDRFNEAYQNTNRSVRSHWMSRFVDNSNRSKMGRTDRLWLYGQGLMDNFDVKDMMRQSMINMADAQRADGSMPPCVPEFVKMPGISDGTYPESPEFGGAIVALPYLYAERYGDDTLKNQYQENIKKYVSYLSSRASNNLLTMGIGDFTENADGRLESLKETPATLVSTALYYQIALMAGDSTLAKSIKDAFIKNCKPGTQTGYAMALDLGLYEPDQKAAMVAGLVESIQKNSNQLSTGVVGTPYLLRALVDNGQDSLFYKVTDKEGSIGLRYLTNHFIRDIVGIQVKGDSIDIYPHCFGTLTQAKGTTSAKNGLVTVSWKIKESRFTIDVESPNVGNTRVHTEELNEYCRKRHLQLYFNIKKS